MTRITNYKLKLETRKKKKRYYYFRKKYNNINDKDILYSNFSLEKQNDESESNNVHFDNDNQQDMNIDYEMNDINNENDEDETLIEYSETEDENILFESNESDEYDDDNDEVDDDLFEQDYDDFFEEEIENEYAEINHQTKRNFKEMMLYENSLITTYEFIIMFIWICQKLKLSKNNRELLSFWLKHLLPHPHINSKISKIISP
jgi:hypothetical protein